LITTKKKPQLFCWMLPISCLSQLMQTILNFHQLLSKD